jgi:hypothetical protein
LYLKKFQSKLESREMMSKGTKVRRKQEVCCESSTQQEERGIRVYKREGVERDLHKKGGKKEKEVGA